MGSNTSPFRRGRARGVSARSAFVPKLKGAEHRHRLLLQRRQQGASLYHFARVRTQKLPSALATKAQFIMKTILGPNSADYSPTL